MYIRAQIDLTQISISSSFFSEKSWQKVWLLSGKFVPLHPLNKGAPLLPKGPARCQRKRKRSLKDLHRQNEVVQEAVQGGNVRHALGREQNRQPSRIACL